MCMQLPQCMDGCQRTIVGVSSLLPCGSGELDTSFQSLNLHQSGEVMVWHSVVCHLSISGEFSFLTLLYNVVNCKCWAVSIAVLRCMWGLRL